MVSIVNLCRKYVRAAGGILIWSLLLFAFLFNVVASIFAPFWLSQWLKHGHDEHVSFCFCFLLLLLFCPSESRWPWWVNCMQKHVFLTDGDSKWIGNACLIGLFPLWFPSHFLLCLHLWNLSRSSLRLWSSQGNAIRQGLPQCSLSTPQ